MARSRRSATRSVGPQSPPKVRQVASERVSANVSEKARASQDVESSRNGKRSRDALPIVEEEEDAGSVAQDDLDSISLNASDSTDDNDAWLQSLDQELIIDGLTLLYHDALKLVSMLDPAKMPQITDELNSATTSIGRRYKQIRAHLHASLAPYRPDDGFLPVELILRKLVEAKGPLSPGATPDAILYLTNLAILVDDVIVKNEQSKIQFLANSFPGEHIFGVFGDPGTTLRHQTITPLTETTIELALSLRTQFFISEAIKHRQSASFDPGDLLNQAFYDDDGQVLGFENQDEETVEEISAAYNRRIKQIESNFSRNSKAPINLKRLQTMFPPQTLFSDLAFWVVERKDELKEQVKIAGGAEAIADLLLEQSIQKVEPDIPPIIEEASVASLPPPSVKDRNPSARMSDKIQQLKRIKARRSAQNNEEETGRSWPHRSRDQQQEIPQSPLLGGSNSDEPNPLVEDDEVVDEPQKGRNADLRMTQGSVVPSQKTAMILQVARRQAAQSNKENMGFQNVARRFTDRQPDARKIGWDDESQEVPRKRQHGRDNHSSDDEDDYETDTRQLKRSKISKPASSSIQHRSRERSGVSETANEYTQEEDDYAVISFRERALTQPEPSRSPLQIRPQKSVRAPTSSAPVRDRDRESSSAYRTSFPRASQAEEVNLQAKAMFRSAQASAAAIKGPKVQNRVAWSIEETERLMDMISMLGTAYSQILEEDKLHPDGPALQDRGQVALKDKARNLKMDFLKAGRELPEGFEYVRIKASDVEKLKSMGMMHHGGPTRGRGQQSEEVEE